MKYPRLSSPDFVENILGRKPSSFRRGDKIGFKIFWFWVSWIFMASSMRSILKVWGFNNRITNVVINELFTLYLTIFPFIRILMTRSFQRSRSCTRSWRQKHGPGILKFKRFRLEPLLVFYSNCNLVVLIDGYLWFLVFVSSHHPMWKFHDLHDLWKLINTAVQTTKNAVKNKIMFTK